MNRDDIRAAKARRRHVDFMRFLWQRREPFLSGLHTHAICERLDEAMRDFGKGKSTYLCIKVPIGHGKSEIVSRYLPANFLGKFDESEVIVSGYAAGLVHDFSRDCRRIMYDDKYRLVYPDVELSDGVHNVAEWSLKNNIGKVHWAGMGGSIVGKRGHLIVIDDFYRNRAEAESEVIRNSRWDNLRHDLLSRIAPTVIFVVLATPWHVDDIFGRIETGMDKDKSFPRFEEMKFPAYSERYKTGVLFPERFSKQWYDGQRATLGEYGAASLLQCDPQIRGGNLLRTDKVQIVKEMPEGLRFVRAWDLASSKKERIKDDPDYTVGVRGAVVLEDTAISHIKISKIYIDDVVRGQWEGAQRNKIILNTAMGDGEIVVGIEAFGAYKDAFTGLRDMLRGIRCVSKMQLPGDKVAKADPLIPIFEAGNIYLKEAPWNHAFIDSLASFPNGKHDDDVDALAVLYHMSKHQPMMYVAGQTGGSNTGRRMVGPQDGSVRVMGC